MSKILLVVIFLSFFDFTAAQTSFTEADIEFFKTQIPGLKQWMKTTNIEDIITYDTITITNNQLKIKFTAIEKKWNKALIKTDSLYAIEFVNYLFDKMVMFFMIERYEDIALIVDTDVKKYIISYDNERHKVITSERKKMGKQVDGDFEIKLTELRDEYITSVKEGSYEKFRVRLKDDLEIFIKGEDKKWYKYWWGEAKMVIHSTYQDKLVIKIMNIKDVITEGGGWEFITLRFNFLQKNDSKFLVTFGLSARHKGGIWGGEREIGSESYEDNGQPLTDFKNKIIERIERLLRK